MKWLEGVAFTVMTSGEFSLESELAAGGQACFPFLTGLRDGCTSRGAGRRTDDRSLGVVADDLTENRAGDRAAGHLLSHRSCRWRPSSCRASTAGQRPRRRVGLVVDDDRANSKREFTLLGARSGGCRRHLENDRRAGRNLLRRSNRSAARSTLPRACRPAGWSSCKPSSQR